MPSYGPSEYITIAAAPNTQSLNFELGVSVTFAVAGRVTAIRYRRTAASADQLSVRGWDPASTATPLFNVQDSAANNGLAGLFTVTLPTPLLIPAGATRRFSVGTGGNCPYYNGLQSVTNSTNCTFNGYVFHASANSYPEGSTTTTSHYVEPVFEPEVEPPGCTDLLQEPFNNLTAWTTYNGAPTIVTGGRTGNGLQLAPNSVLDYSLPTPSQSSVVTVGFAWRTANLGSAVDICQLRSDAGATDHLRIQGVNGSQIQVTRAGTFLGATGFGVIAINTWYYVEVQAKLHDTTGAVTVRVNGTTVLTLTNVDTKNAGTKTVFDTLRLLYPVAGSTSLFDDLYLSAGTTCTFQGDHAIGGSVSGAGATTITFTATATATAFNVGAGATTITFTATATALPPTVVGAAHATMHFRALARSYLAFYEWGRWSLVGETDDTMTSGTIRPQGGSTLIVLYALRVDDVQSVLSLADEWGTNGVNPITAIDDTFAGTPQWRAYTQGTFMPGAAPPDEHSWMLAAAYVTLGPDPGDGHVTAHTVSFDYIPATFPAFAWMDVIEVQHGAGVQLAGGVQDVGYPTSEFVGGADAAYWIHQAIGFGLVMADAVPAHPVITAPQSWGTLRHDTVTTKMELATGFFRGAEADTEAQAMPHAWSALPIGAYSHNSLAIAVVPGPPPPPVPVPFAEFLVEYLDETGAWVDITCDTRTCDINAGRQDTLEQFNAATLTLTMANFADRYSGWPPDSVWAAAGQYRTDIPIRVNMLTRVIDGGAVVDRPHPLFTGTTDAVSDAWPGVGADAMVTVTASDGFKKLARAESTPLPKNPDGTDQTVGALETTGQRIARWVTTANYHGPDPALPDTALDVGLARMEATPMGGNALAVAQATAFTEGLGTLYVRADGVLVFRQRDALAHDPRMTTVQATFTDRDGDPEGACYGDIKPVTDDTIVYNVAKFTAHPATLEQVYIDPASRVWFGERTYPPAALGVHEDNDALAAAIMVVTTHADSDKRVDSIMINAGNDPAVWDVAVNVALLDRVRVVRHYPGGFLLDEELLVQGVSHHLEGTGVRVPGIWTTTYRTAKALPTAGFCHWDTGQWDSCTWSI